MADAQSATQPPKKKSVALSGTVAGNTAICTVGRSGNDLHYRGYDIADLAASATYEEVAFLLVHGRLPAAAELAAYRTKLRRLRGLPGAVRAGLEQIPAAAHPMDVLRTGCSILGTVLPEKDEHPEAGARDIADRLLASLGSMLLYWHHFVELGAPDRGGDRRRGDRRALPPPAARRARPPPCTRGRSTGRSSSTPSTSSTPRPSPGASWPAPRPTSTRP